MHKKSHFIIFNILFGIVLIILTAYNPLFSLYLLIGTGLGYIFLKNHLVGLALVLLSTILGEPFGRLSIGPGLGLFIPDVLTAILVLVWIFKKLTVSRKFEPSKIAPFYIAFIAVAFASLINSLRYIDPSAVLESSFYLIRFIEYTALYLVTLDTCHSERAKSESRNLNNDKLIFYISILATILIAITGFIQLKLFPSFDELEMADYGWDPHIDRLLGTWFDPNFIGGLFAFILCLILGVFFFEKKFKIKGIYIVIGLFLLISLFLTYSRGSYVAFAGGAFLIGALKSRKFLIGAIIATIMLVSVSDRAQERIINMYHSATSILFDTAANPDPTARLRVESWQNAMILVKKYPIIGTGYNTYKYVSKKEGLLKDVEAHHASGSDSSLLTIFATTGILGFLPFVIIFIIILKESLDNFRNKKLKNFNRGYSLGVFGGTITMLLHSIFVNSLLYVPLMIFYWIAIGIMEHKKYKT